MQTIINYPCNVKKENLGIRIKGFDFNTKENKTLLLNPTKIDEIILTKQPSSISTGIFELNPNLTISIFNRGNPSHFIIPSKNLPKILKNEELFFKLSKYKKRKLMWTFCKAVCSGRIKVLSRLNETRKNENIKEILKEMRNLDRSLINAKTRQEIMGIEGNIAKNFYFALSEMNREFAFEFERRDRRSIDVINVLMNFMHTVLRNKIQQRLILNGINPYHSFLHENHRGQPSLTFDFAEFWIAYIDKLIFYSLERGIVKKEDIKNGRLKRASIEKCINLINLRIKNEEIDFKIKEFMGFLKGKNKFSWKPN